MRHAFTTSAVALATMALAAGCSTTPDTKAPASAAPPSATLDVVAEIIDTRPGNIAVTPQGRVILSNHPLDQPRLRVVELLPDGTKAPFPTLDWSNGPETGEVGIASIIGVGSTTDGVVWMLDMGAPGHPPSLVGWDTIDDELAQQIVLPDDVVTPISFLQDFAIDERRGLIYIADMTLPAPGEPSSPAIVVVDLASGDARRVLEGAEPLMPSERNVVIQGSFVAADVNGITVPLHLGVNPIAIDPAFDWVYFGTINGDRVFRLPAEALSDPALDDAALAASIEVYGPKPPSDGIAVDGRGRVYITDIEGSAIGVTTPGEYTVIAQDDELLAWPDGFAFGPDGSLYATQNHLNAHPALNAGNDTTVKPFRIVRLELAD
ncbi:MAG: L-dopachrome tautomerase-related protein [Planctomycetota bacterium]